MRLTARQASFHTNRAVDIPARRAFTPTATPTDIPVKRAFTPAASRSMLPELVVLPRSLSMLPESSSSHSTQLQGCPLLPKR